MSNNVKFQSLATQEVGGKEEEATSAPAEAKEESK